ncbi:hypothetical protein Glove_362g21 [Diversispora epigaea]|uniref:Uncharacterized protein n=1 Tax=Diversispora epigaea TaxID=1348612 RepID=A0A397H974_9GLOM|nr:hypothetical protein Glove_362g21 [Diversispora epigaea]
MSEKSHSTEIESANPITDDKMTELHLEMEFVEKLKLKNKFEKLVLENLILILKIQNSKKLVEEEEGEEPTKITIAYRRLIEAQQLDLSCLDYG